MIEWLRNLFKKEPETQAPRIFKYVHELNDVVEKTRDPKTPFNTYELGLIIRSMNARINEQHDIITEILEEINVRKRIK